MSKLFFSTALLLLIRIGSSHAQCQPPPVVTVATVTLNAATITWQAVTGATGYEIAYATTPAPTTGSFVSGTATTLSGLAANTKYYFCVRTVCPGPLYSPWKCDSLVTTLCDSPAFMLATGTLGNDATLIWPSVATPVFYEYYIAPSPSTPPTNGISTTDTTIILKGLPLNTVFDACVRAKCVGGWAYSVWVCDTFKTGSVCNVPDTIDNPLVFGPNRTISWTPTGFMGYQYAIGLSPFTPSLGVSTMGHSVNITGLILDTFYTFCVRAKCDTNTYSAWKCDTFQTHSWGHVAPVSSKAGALKIYPNPAKDIVSIELNSSTGNSGTLLVTDVLGAMVYHSEINGRRTEIDVSSFSKGIYLIKYTSINSSIVSRLIKE
jgi:hypothetical protein